MVITAALAAAAVRLEALTSVAGAVAFAFGSAIVVLGGFAFLALLVLFVFGSVLATRYRFEEKRRQNLQEGTRGERGVSNVLAHIIVPALLVLLGAAAPDALPTGSVPLLYASALAFGAADTFASEFGVLAGHARSILTGRPVPPGTNGGVSSAGEAWALVGALATAAVGALLFRGLGPAGGVGLGFVALAALSGFLACQVDSLLGELLENRGRLTKGGTNLAAMVSAVLIAFGLSAMLGWG